MKGRKSASGRERTVTIMKDDSINRQAAVDAVLGVIPYDEYWLEQVNKAIEALPPADTVEVVRCKDCRYGHRFFDVINGTTDSWIECRNPDGLNRDTSEVSFCSCGERKDE